MRQKITYLILGVALTCISAQAQKTPDSPNEHDMYCSGVVTTQALPNDFYVISGQESDTRVTYHEGDSVFLNRGANQGIKIGDQFLVSRPVKDPESQEWFSWQHLLLRTMGRTYADIGRLRVVAVQPNTTIAEIVRSCQFMQRGDLVQAFAERPAPPYKPAEAFDKYAPDNGKAKAMIVTTKGFGQVVGEGTTVYINLGAAQGVKVGDYFRIFHYQGTHDGAVYQTRGTAHRMYGFGATPVSYGWSDLPRDVLGEGIVVRVGPNASSVVITFSLREIFAGDYVELE